MTAMLLAVAVLPAGGQPAAPGCALAAPDARAAGPGCAQAWFDANLHVNEIQAVGTADSYKQRPSPAMLALVRRGSDDDVKALDFAQPPLAQQLDAGARSLEFDIAWDPKGGLYKYPAGAAMVDELVPDDYIAAMTTPGFKVVHVLDIDFTTSCMTLAACLETVAAWSRAHPSHVPLVINLTSNDVGTPMPGATRPAKFTPAVFDALDAEIRTVFRPDEIITPDQVQGAAPTLRDAVKTSGWPLLGAARGKVMFVLDDKPAKTALYRGARKSLEGRVMFIAADIGSPAAAFVTVENPAKQSAAVMEAVKAGFMVRTYADSDTREARAGTTIRRDWALASGAQVISTDFLLPDGRIGRYQVRLAEGHTAQCNVQLAPRRCFGLDVESPDGVKPH